MHVRMYVYKDLLEYHLRISSVTTVLWIFFLPEKVTVQSLMTFKSCPGSLLINNNKALMILQSVTDYIAEVVHKKEKKHTPSTIMKHIINPT